MKFILYWLSDLLRYPAVLPSRGTFTREILEQAIHQHGLYITSELSTNYLETLKMLVSIGLGWSLLPQTLVDDEILPIEVENMHLSRSLGIVRHRQRTLSNAARAMWSSCTKASD